MATTTKRFMLSVTKDIEAETDYIKKKAFYDKPYSEMYRYLIRLGVNSFNNIEKQQRA